MLRPRNFSVMSLSVADAAIELGVSATRVRALIAAGALAARKVSGVYVIDDQVLDELAQRERVAHVRAFSPRLAWASAALADGTRPSWLRHDELSRLRSRMDRVDQSVGAWQARLAARATASARYRIGEALLEPALADERTVRSGESSTGLTTDPFVATTQSIWVCGRDDLASVRQHYGLLPSDTGNLTVRTVEVAGLSSLGTGDGNAFRLIVAADLLESGDARSRYAGTELLAAVLGERLWVRR